MPTEGSSKQATGDRQPPRNGWPARKVRGGHATGNQRASTDRPAAINPQQATLGSRQPAYEGETNENQALSYRQAIQHAARPRGAAAHQSPRRATSKQASRHESNEQQSQGPFMKDTVSIGIRCGPGMAQWGRWAAPSPRTRRTALEPPMSYPKRAWEQGRARSHLRGPPLIYLYGRTGPGRSTGTRPHRPSARTSGGKRATRPPPPPRTRQRPKRGASSCGSQRQDA